MLSRIFQVIFFIPRRTQWNGWKPFTRFAYVASMASVIGLFFTLAWSWYTRPQTPPPKAYDLSDARRTKFRELLQVTSEMHVDRLRVGCVAWSEDSCIAAGEFAALFSEAGWDIEGNQVIKVDTTVPVKGVSIVARNAPILALPQLPLHEGRWGRIDMSNQLIMSAFRIMDNPVHSSSDPSLPNDNTLGIYFGPNTDLFSTVNSEKKKQGERLFDFVKNGLAIEQMCLKSSIAACKGRRVSWEAEVKSYIDDQKFGDDKVSSWVALSCNGVTASNGSIGKQLNFLSGLFLLNSGPIFPS